MAYLSPTAGYNSLPRSPSPSTRPLIGTVASMMENNGIEGKGWEISFDTDTDTDGEEDLDSRGDVSVPCRYSRKYGGQRPDGLELYNNIDTEVMLDTANRRYSNLSAHEVDIYNSSGSASASGGSVHTPSTVHTAIISILPPTTASTANFPLDIFPSPPKSYNELGPLRSRPNSPDYQYQTSNRNSTAHRLSCRHDRHRRRFSEPTGSSSREALIEQWRYTMSFDYIVASAKSRINGNGNGIQERVVRVGFSSKRRSSIGGNSISSLNFGCSKSGGEKHERGDRVREYDWQAKGIRTGNGVSNSSKQESARVCVFDSGKDNGQQESTSSPLSSSPSLPNTVVLPLASTTSTTTHAPLWPSLPSGPSSPNSNFTSYHQQQNTLPPGRVLSGFSDINYSSCSFSVDDHDHDHRDRATGVKVDLSPTIPGLPLHPDSVEYTSAVGVPTTSYRTRPLVFNRPRPAPLPLGLSLKSLPPIPSASDISPGESLLGITQTITALPTTPAIYTVSTTGGQTQSLIGEGDHKDSFSASTKYTYEGQQGDKEFETILDSNKPCFEKVTSLPSTCNLPLAEIARPASPSNANQYIPSTRAKGIEATTIDFVESAVSIPSSTTIDTTVPPLASPISIYSQHTSRSSPASMPLSLNRSHQDWDQQDSFNPTVIPVHPYLSKTPSSRNGFTPRSENIVTPDSGTTSPPPSYTHFTGNNLRRVSKFSGSSNASSYSSETSSIRHEKGVYATAERPDISTVFEEEDPSLDEESESQRTDSDRDRDRERAREPKDSTGNAHVHGTSRMINNTVSRHHQSHLSQSSSAPSLASHTLAIPDRRPRKNTVSTVHSTGAKSTKSNHPFASSAVRPPSPVLPPSSSSKLAIPESARGGISLSRSQPNLAERYKASNDMHQPHQVTLVSEEDARDEGDNCPVCCESLSFTYRLPGEKPHIVPECGHSLHEECFVTVYGDVPPEGSRRHLGVCGVCRQQMKLGGGGEQRKGGNKSKLAMLMGQPSGDQGSNSKFAAPSIRSVSGQSAVSSPHTSDPLADDPLEPMTGVQASNSSRSLANDAMPSQPKVVVPAISVRSEYPSIARSRKGGKQLVTTMVTVRVPSAGSRGLYPARHRPTGMHSPNMQSPQLPPSPMSNVSPSLEYPSSRSAISVTPSTPNTFAHVVADLKNRVVDFKTSGLDSLGRLRLFDLLSVRKGDLVREFHVYLFQEALICISEEKRTGLRGMFSSASSIRSGDSGSSSSTGRGILRLKGRIYVKHVHKILDSSRPYELSLTITMVDEDMDSFILTFKDRGSHETWKTNLNRLIEETKGVAPLTGNSASKVAKMMGMGVPLPKSASSKGFTPTSSVSHQGQSAAGMSSFGDLASPSTIHSFNSPATATLSPQETAAGNLAFMQPLAPVHTPIDIVICLSLPSPSMAAGANLPLKVRLMRQSLAFTLALLGPKDRISLVACEMGQAGIVRKTPFLNTTRFDSRRRLEAFVESLGSSKVGEDEFEVTVGPNERQDVVTAVNVALDVVLQRKSKNPLTGMILLSDTSDIIKRAQMELVTARLDAANVPVHCLGYGKSHDPSPLWMLSNHTHGTYTFVKEWYDLRDTLAGVVGGLMSIALTNMKLHLNSAENDFKITKVSGTVSAIVSHDGKHVDIELGELRHGETREILVEMELGNGNGSSGESGEQQYSSGSSEGDNRLSVPPGQSDRSASRQAQSFSTRGSGANGLGLDMLSVNDSNALYEDALIDEVPVTEVDCSFTDPSAGRSVARLAHPVLLTLALLPPNSPPSSTQPDPTLVRRRMELLTSDMITRALLIASRKNFSHAARILRETKKIVETMSDGMRGNLHPSGHARSKREVQTLMAVEGLTNTLNDVDMLLDGLEEHKELFERDHRNYAAQQAIVLKSQKSWTTRTPSERYYCTKEVQRIIQLSGEYSAKQ